MNKRRMLFLGGGSVLVLLILGSVVASQTSYTPLYMVRMEQASSRMNFMPAEVNEFAYAAGAGYTLNYDVQGCCGGITPDTWTFGSTCDGTCTEPTCADTCRLTCDDPTCEDTCPATCPLTCDTCTSTCTTCGGTCYITCSSTCLCGI